jgi:glycosyltransferase involved in cell wall biosynthesis
MRVAVVIPALDEEESLPAVLGDLPPVWRIVVADNGSRDRTADLARASGAEVVIEPRRGYGAAVLAGLRHLERDPPDIVVILDADHADHPELIDQLVEPIRADRADLVLADRSASHEPGALNPPQVVGNWLATRLIRVVSGHSYRDMGPFRAIRWTSLQALRMEDATWGWNVEMQLKALRRGLRVLEVPMPYRRRRAGQSKISGTVRGVVRAGGRILWAVRWYRKDR